MISLLLGVVNLFGSGLILGFMLCLGVHIFGVLFGSGCFIVGLLNINKYIKENVKNEL